MKSKKAKIVIVLFFVSILYTFLINTINVASIKSNNPSNYTDNARSLVHNATIYSIDNYWYVNHIKNYITANKFTVDTTKQFYEVRRTPIYPMFYGIHYLAFGEEGSYYYIRFTQTFILAIAVIFLFLAVFNFTNSYTISILSALLYGLQPSIVTGAYFTNSESLSSELVCFIFYALSLCKLNSTKRNWFIFGLLFALGTLCRPSIVFLAPACLFAVFYFNRWKIKNIVLTGCFFLFGAAVLFLPWTIRNYKVTNGDIVFLEKYYGDPMDYGMPNIYLRKWIACWTNPADYSSERVSNLMRLNLSQNEPTNKDVILDSLAQNIPAKSLKGNSKANIRQAYSDLYEFYRSKDKHNTSMSYDSIERVVTKSMLQLRENFISASPLDYYVITPLSFAKSVIFQSTSTSLTFLDHYQGNFIKTAFKAVLYLINVFSFLSILFLAFYYRKYCSLFVISLLYTLITFLVIIYSLQYFENRYLFPIMPFLYTLLGISLYECYRFFKKKLHF